MKLTLYLLLIHINFCLVCIGSNLVSSQQTFYLVQIEENEKAIGKVAEIAIVRSKVSCYARYKLMVCKLIKIVWLGTNFLWP